MMTSEDSGALRLCRKHPNPDLWFSDTNPRERVGKPFKHESLQMITDTRKAISICNTPCPYKTGCKAEGMRPENLEHGVWAGMLPIERQLEAGIPIRSTDKNKLIFAQKVRDV